MLLKKDELVAGTLDRQVHRMYRTLPNRGGWRPCQFSIGAAFLRRTSIGEIRNILLPARNRFAAAQDICLFKLRCA
jgi:hypothetical protein